MVFALAVLSNFLLASIALAAPRSNLADRIARRREGRQSQPNNRIDSVESTVSNVEFSQNWSGAAWDSFPAGTFKTVTGTITVPTPSGSSGAASAWVGIDGDTCGTAILQTGIDFTISNGGVSFNAWYEYFPAASVDFSGMSVTSGDVMQFTVTAATTNSGTAVIENLTTGQKVSKSLTSSHALCLENAEWIVEDFEEGGSLVPFGDFGTVTFTNAVATTQSGTTVTPAGATLIEIEQNGQVLTSVSTSGNDLTISFV